MNIGFIILAVIVGIVLGIIGGGVWMLISSNLQERKAKKDFAEGKKVFEVITTKGEKDGEKVTGTA